MLPLLFLLSLPAQAPSYARDVRPFFTRYCVECHTAAEPEGGLVLETYAGLIAGGKRGPAVVPGKPDEGPLVRMIEGKLKPVMPPSKSRQPTSAEVAKVRAWILGGAKDDAGTLKVTLPKLAPRKRSHPPVLAVAASPDGKQIAAAGRGEVIVLNPSGDVIARHKLDRDRVTALAYHRELLAVASGSAGEGYDVRLFPVANDHTGRRVSAQVILRHDDTIQALAFSPDGRWLATASYDRLIRLWNVKEGKPGPVLKDHSDAVYGVAFSPDSKWLASGGADRAVKVWDVASGNRLYTLGESTDWVYGVAWSPVSNRIAAAGVDKSIRVWEVDGDGGKVALSAFAHEGPVVRLVYSRDGKTLVSIGEDRVLKVWDAGTLTERLVHPAQPETCLSLALSANDQTAFVGRYDGALVVLELRTGKGAGQFRLHREAGEATPSPSAIPGREGKPPTPPQSLPGIIGALTHPARHYRGVDTPRSPLSGSEVEPNDSARTGQKTVWPVAMAGTIGRPGDVDWFNFEAKLGDEIGVMVKIADKTLLDPVLRLVNAEGDTVAESASGTLGHVVSRAGTYALGLWDRDYRGSEKAAYTLHIGPIPVITSVFPLGVPRGTTSEVRVEGVNLGKERSVKLTVPADAKPGSRIPIELGIIGAVTHSAHPTVVVGEFPEVADGKPIPTPGTANGLIAKPGTAQTWKFGAKRNRRVILEVHASRLGSPLDSTIEILDDKGRPLPRAVLRSMARTYTVFRDNDSRSPGIRIETWGELAVNDLLLIGNELVKIRALPRNPDDDCQFFQDGGRRVGFLGTTPTHHSVGSPMFKVSVHPPGTTFPPNGLPSVTLTYRNDDGGAETDKDSRLVFDPPADGDYQIRVTDARGEGGVAHAYRLTVREPRPDFSVSLAPAAPTLFPGGATPLQVNVTRLDDFNGTIDVELKNLPAGVSAPKSNIGPDDATTSIAVFAEPGIKLPAKMTPLEVVARAKINGNDVVRSAVGGMVKLANSPDLLTATQQPEATIRPGGETRVTVVIERRNGFTGRVPLEVRGLPHGVRVLDVGLNGILIVPSETKRTFVLYAEPWVAPMEHPIVVFARREGKPEEYAAKSVLLRVK